MRIADVALAEATVDAAEADPMDHPAAKDPVKDRAKAAPVDLPRHSAWAAAPVVPEVDLEVVPEADQAEDQAAVPVDRKAAGFSSSSTPPARSNKPYNRSVTRTSASAPASFS